MEECLKLNILFRCDGSVEIGMGHVIRCLALADELSEYHKCNIHFAIRQSELGINKVKEFYPVLESNEKAFNYENWLKDCINKINSQILILDVRDGLKKRELKQLKKMTGIKVVTIDDPEDKRLEADMAFYPPILQVKQLDWGSYEGQLYSGWEYVILRPEFQRNYSKPHKENLEILVAMGATDPHNLTLKVLNAIDKLYYKLTIKVLIGTQFLFEEELNDFCKKSSKRIVIKKNPENVAQIMSGADMAIISFGMTAYETVALNVPAIYISVSPDHALSASTFVNAGLGVSVGLHIDLNNSLIQNEVKRMIEKEILTNKPLKDRKLIDGFGADRIAGLLIKEFSEDAAHG